MTLLNHNAAGLNINMFKYLSLWTV